uniref:Uncharacterized protein n=1 Tax=Leishmania guyanensis TaxID=5670 RepID=A0A1E1IQX9_LEIGU|nr:hypothetical protein, unknown function [Leishmania guyanensis]
MVYKHKHNKKARSIAARKLQKAAEVAAAAAAVAATLVPVGGDGESATAGYCDAGLSSTLSTGGMATSCAPVTINCKYGTAAAAESLTDANMGAADAEEMFQEKQSKTRQQQQQPGTSGDRSCSDMSGLLYSAPPTPADWARLSVASGAARLPSVLAATHLPCIPGITPCSPRSGADGGGEGQYVAYLLSEQLSNGTMMPMTMWGVYSLRDGDCLQVVHWHHSPVAQESPLTNVGLHPPPTSSNAQQTRELIMRVDAAGLCFMLAPSSLVSMDGSGAAGCMTLNSVCSDPDTADDAAAESADVYWLIPSVMKESFFALLQAREWLRTAPLRHPVSEACTRSLECQGWFVQPHPTRWASAASSVEATVTVAREQHKSSSPATATLPLPKRKTKKAKRKRRQPSPRAQPRQCKESTASTTSATNGTAPTSPFQYLIPYVAAVQQPQKGLRGVPESHLPSAAVPAATATPVVLLIGNRIASYPAGEVCGPRM